MWVVCILITSFYDVLVLYRGINFWGHKEVLGDNDVRRKTKTLKYLAAACAPSIGLIDAVILASGNRHVRNKLWSCVRGQGEDGGSIGSGSEEKTNEVINPLDVLEMPNTLDAAPVSEIVAKK